MNRSTGWLAAAIVAVSIVARAADGQEPAPQPALGLSMTPAVACKRVDGLDRFEPLPSATLTSEDKLKVYFRPLNFKVEATKTGHRVRFTEDGRVRRKGEKTPLSKEDKLLEYEERFEMADVRVCLINTIGLKNLKPGEYEFDIILHDELDPGSTARQTLPFTIIPTPPLPPDSKVEKPGESEDPTGSPKSKAKAKGKTARPKATRPVQKPE